MRSGAKGLAVVVATMIAATALLVLPQGAAGAAKGDNQCWESRTSEKRFKNKINNERTEVSLGKLHLDPELSKVARKHTKEMIQADKGLFHSTTAQLTKRVTTYSILGENVGVGGSVPSLHQAFMDSPPHAANVLHASYEYVGVGAKRDDDGRLWVTIIFQGGNNPGTTLKMPDCS